MTLKTQPYSVKPVRQLIFHTINVSQVNPLNVSTTRTLKTKHYCF